MRPRKAAYNVCFTQQIGLLVRRRSGLHLLSFCLLHCIVQGYPQNALAPSSKANANVDVSDIIAAEPPSVTVPQPDPNTSTPLTSNERGTWAMRQPCHRRTNSGLCPGELFQWFDWAYSDVWPGRVDLLIRSFVSDKFYLLQSLFRTIEQMWPKNIGDIVLVLDQGNDVALDLVPTWIKVMYETNYMSLGGKIQQQWSYFWADNYTTAPYVAIIDDDVVLTMKVTPGTIFNLTTGTPYMIGSGFQRPHWQPATDFFVGEGHYTANYMVQLPFVFPRDALPAFRAHVAVVRPEHGSFDNAMKWWSINGGSTKYQIAHTTLGNYLAAFCKDKVYMVEEGSDTNPIPVPRVGLHLPYSKAYETATSKLDAGSAKGKYISIFTSLAGQYSHEAVCHAFPPGELQHCEHALRGRQEVVWVYAFDWHIWSLMYRHNHKRATAVYDQYKTELYCLYGEVARAEAGAGGGGALPASGEALNALKAQLRADCVRRNSSFPLDA